MNTHLDFKHNNNNVVLRVISKSSFLNEKKCAFKVFHDEEITLSLNEKDMMRRLVILSVYIKKLKNLDDTYKRHGEHILDNMCIGEKEKVWNRVEYL